MSILCLGPNALLEENPLALDVCAATREKIVEFLRPVFTVRQRIKRQINFSTGREPGLEIAEQKVPFARSPARTRFGVAIETDRKCGDPVQGLFKVRQRFEWFDPKNDPRHFENFEQFAE